MIILRLQGGIGNQLFQYAVARHIALKNNTQLKFDISSYQEYPLRQYSLGNFNIQEAFAYPAEIRKLKNSINKFLDFFKPYYKRSHIKERSFHFDPSILQISQDAYIDGYWQSEKYFSAIENIIRKEITLKNPLSNESQKVAQEMQSSNSISLHIRRGDYATRENIKRIIGLCPPEYYYSAIEEISKIVNNPKFFVFSDDIPWVKENLKIDHPTIFVSEKISAKGGSASGGKSKDHEELILMSQCKNHIIANSSFSWWGAWLSSYQNKIVIAPKKWFNDPSKDTQDLLPSSWVTI